MRESKNGEARRETESGRGNLREVDMVRVLREQQNLTLQSADISTNLGMKY